MSIAIVHDYLTQRGGAERVVLSILRAFPDAELYTSLYEPETTFPEFERFKVRTLPIDSVRLLRKHHRLALPLLARSFSRLEVEADHVLCSSSGWAHGARVEGRKIVYCHAPARWLYQRDRYAPHGLQRAILATLAPSLRRWDRRAARSADKYLANSSLVAGQIRRVYGREAVIVPPPWTLDTSGARASVRGLDPGFFLCVSRLAPYKNVDAVVRAFAHLPDARLVVVGTGPEQDRLESVAGANVTFLGTVADDGLRWLYDSCRGLVAASFEDFGLTPLEAAAFGKPTAALRYGGYLDTVVEGVTGVFFDRPEPVAVADALRELVETEWARSALLARAWRFDEPTFVRRLRDEVLAT